MIAKSDSSNVIGFGLVGFGRFCQNRLIPAFRQTNNARISAIWKRSKSEAEAEAQKYGIPAGYGDLSDLLKHPGVDAVYVTSANNMHEAHVIAAAKAGKHVLCEKPLSITAESCLRIVESCNKANVKLMVAHNLRYSEAILEIKRISSSGQLGEVVSGSTVFTYDGSKSPRSWLYDPHLAGGGAMIDIGVHCLDTLRFLLGEIVEVQSMLDPPKSQNRIEESTQVNLRFASGALGSILCSYKSPYYSRLEIQGSAGRALVEPFTLPEKDVLVKVERNGSYEGIPLNTGNSYSRMIEAFSASIQEDNPAPIPGEEGLINQTIIDQVYSDQDIGKFSK
ncbi:hypothetical protein CEE37_04600 [candidate division LCP-89 bacterium B3_LCP]|uniref:Dehydrogenase n=1 Tax=candidate division LCP-89 bacterium B3_LCP TaxID=2012998 RepID=A0A532V402_UNCL8|nr:MAG: hypothetical protein CEE37_04600 [candidate division LCP-89 bacterium B3_LCP]